MKKNLHFLLLLMAMATGLQAMAAVPSGYYNNAKNKSDQALMAALHEIINGHTKRSYANLWSDFRTTDCNGTTIIDRYSNSQFTYSSSQCGSGGYSGVGDCYNREHSVPNSWWGGTQDTMYTDLFHMYPVDGWVNGERSNYPFGDCANGIAKGTGKLGTCTFSGYTGQVFEVADEYKGDFARTYFYMVVRYMDRVGSWTSDYGSAVFTNSSYKHLTTWAINQLLEWHRMDPVSTLESNRNDAVYGIQHNRNPFIDNPELAEYIWGNMQGNAWNSGTTPTPTPTLIAPTNGTTVNVGTNTGSGVSKTITVSGSNLTKALSVSVTGTGFSVTPTSITATNANNGTSVTVTYNGTATNATGTLTISSTEVSATVNLTASYSSGSSQTGDSIETWEGCSTYGSYSTTFIQGHAFKWNTNNVGIWANDAHCNGTYSCRFGKNVDSYIEMAEDFANGASEISFYAANWGNNEAAPTLQVLYSTNAGSSWTMVGTCSPTTTWQTYTFNLNVSGNVRFKIQQTAGARLNIDDIAIKSNGGSAPATPELTAPVNGSTVNVGTITATGTSVSKTITVSGSNLTKALTVSVTGTGFSVTPTTISAANANNGTTVTVTYTSSTSGNATGTLTIGSSEASVTVNLTASKTANPTITAPVNGSTVNVGTIAATGTSVSKTINVSGNDLSRALSVSVTGTGFSVTPTTISASNANNGTTVTVTYTSSTSGDATGTLTIGSSEASVTVNLTARKIANPTILITSIPEMVADLCSVSSVSEGTVSADDNSNPITLSVEGNFEISLDAQNWASSLTLDPTGETFYVRLADTETPGEYYGSLTATTGVVSAYADLTGTVNEQDWMFGDVNRDRIVDIADITLLISYVLNGAAEGVFDERAANCDNNDLINIADITILINYVLTGGIQNAARNWDAKPAVNGIVIEDPTGEVLEVYDMDGNCVAVTASGTSIDLPAGIYVVTSETANRKVVVK